MALAATLKPRINAMLRALQTFGVPKAQPALLRTFPHDPQAYTQGLSFHDGALYESTGQWESSTVRRVDPDSGQVLEKLAVAGDFAEGIAVHSGQLFQLTWKSGRVLIYDLQPLHLVREMAIDREGWGLANDGAHLLASDGGSSLRRYDPAMTLVDEIKVRAGGLPLRHLNDIEVARGSVYVNIWYTALIAQIDLLSGRVLRLLDCAELERIERPGNPHQVMNGIAYNAQANTFFLTGKCWRNCFEVSFPD